MKKKIFKINRGVSPEVPTETFVSETSLFNLRTNDTFAKRQVHSVYHGSELLPFSGPKIWDIVPAKLKQSESLDSFKIKIKKWIPFKCLYRLRKPYM